MGKKIIYFLEATIRSEPFKLVKRKLSFSLVLFVLMSLLCVSQAKTDSNFVSDVIVNPNWNSADSPYQVRSPNDISTKNKFLIQQNTFVRTSNAFPWNTANFNLACQQEYGPSYRIADWNEVISFININGYNEFYSQSGMTTYRSNGWVTRAGQHLWSSNRHYFIERHDGSVPSGWLVHAAIGSNSIDLGSWYNSRPILCYRFQDLKFLDLSLFIQGFYSPVTNLGIQDTIRIYLRNSSSPFAVIDSAKVKLSASGNVNINFLYASNATPYYIQIKHRNSIETWSSTANSFVNSSLTYNFTDSNLKAFGNNMARVNNTPVTFAIYSGDVNQDGNIDVLDNGLADDDAFNFVTGYVKTDVTGNNVVDANDLAIIDNNAFNFISKVTPP